MELGEPIEMLSPLSDCARFSIGDLPVTPSLSATSLRSTMSNGRLSPVEPTPSSFWPRTKARITVGPEELVKSTEPASTAFIEPMPTMSWIDTLSPRLVQNPSSSAM